MAKNKNGAEWLITLALLGTGALGVGAVANFTTPSLPVLMSMAKSPIATMPKIPTMNAEQFIDEAKSVGFNIGVKDLDQQKRHAIAETKYPKLTKLQIDRFNSILRRKTVKETTETDDFGLRSQWRTYKEVVIDKVEDYKGVPPEHVVASLKQAKESGLFDSFEIASIKERQVRIDSPTNDPLLLGKIGDDYFVIAQWNKDISYEEIVKK